MLKPDWQGHYICQTFVFNMTVVILKQDDLKGRFNCDECVGCSSVVRLGNVSQKGF